MITTITVWLCLITHVVYGTMSTVITVNNNTCNCTGNSSCISLSCALKNMKNNTMIDITLKVVSLCSVVEMGSGNLNNITITGNGATIMCNNTGGVYCESCSNVIIRGITWHRCGGRDSARQIPALNFTNTASITIHRCMFQSSLGCPIYAKTVKNYITVNESHFVENIFDSSSTEFECAGLYVDTGGNNLNLTISLSAFYSNRGGMPGIPKHFHHYGVVILGCINHCEMINITINDTIFNKNSCGMFLSSGITKRAMIYLSNLTVSNSTACGVLVHTPTGDDPTLLTIAVSLASFKNNVNALRIVSPTVARQLRVTMTISNLIFNDNIANNSDVFTSHSKGLAVLGIDLKSSKTLVTIENCHFYNNLNGAVSIHLSPYISECTTALFLSITFTDVTIYNTTTTSDVRFPNAASVSIITDSITSMTTKLINVNFTSNNYSRHGEVLRIANNEFCSHIEATTDLINCTFENNKAFDHVIFLHAEDDMIGEHDTNYITKISECNFDSNYGGESIVYVVGPTSSFGSSMTLDNSMFSNNNGTALFVTYPEILFLRTILFVNNRANSGAAIYFEGIHSILSINANVQFDNNIAEQTGGALYFNLITDYCNVFTTPINAFFINNSANIAGNSIYFSIPLGCQIVTNSSDTHSLLYIPMKFNYSQSIQAPVVTSPHSIRLYPPAMAIDNSSNEYIIQLSKMLGEPIQFSASVFDYFNNITEPVLFIISCSTCGDDFVLSTYQVTIHDKSVLKLKILPLKFSDVDHNINISITMLSSLPPVCKSLKASLSVNISPCRAGYLFDKLQKQCVCYPYSDIVHCSEQYSEIKIGYWVGPMKKHYTSSICPSSYCGFAKRKEISPGYFKLPETLDGQCNSHRTGVACGECKPGYTLAYDSPKCINKDKCSAGMICLVIVLTILYWVTIVVVVLALMYFQFPISSGYAYGIIYYYSIVDILLGNDASDEVLQLVNILSSFAKLTPRLFGQLCLAEGLSGIDQQFIHYSHAVAVSLILLCIVLVTRYSPRLAVVVSRCIIRVICLLLLLAYTSIASTSLQLLRPLTFNGVDEVRTYSSPGIKYFTGRHFAYAIVAILCKLIIVIGLPLFLFFEPLLSRKINFVKIKPLLDQFQGCYKDKYHWFAMYYLICREVIIFIMYVGNGDYYHKLYYLQTACIIIAMIHGLIQPYKKKIVNGLDLAILLILVLIINLNTFPSLYPVSSQLSIVLLFLPLFILCLIGIRKLLIRCYDRKKKTFYLYNPVDADDNLEEDEDYDNDYNEPNDMRFVLL